MHGANMKIIYIEFGTSGTIHTTVCHVDLFSLIRIKCGQDFRRSLRLKNNIILGTIASPLFLSLYQWLNSFSNFHKSLQELRVSRKVVQYGSQTLPKKRIISHLYFPHLFSSLTQIRYSESLYITLFNKRDFSDSRFSENIFIYLLKAK